jgi:DNA invertase Pin-like site-specific DNA recombinase
VTKGTKVAGYIRVSTEDQGESGAGLEAQRAAITAEAERRGWQLVEIFEDTASGKSMSRRPGLAAALAAVDSGQVDALCVAKLDRLSRSLLDFAGLVERSRKQGWQLVALDLGVDTASPSGEMMASVLAVFAQFERRLISQRTTDALRTMQSRTEAAGHYSQEAGDGLLRGPLGRPRQLPDDIRRRILREAESGATPSMIARGLDSDGVPTAQGGAWYPATVKKIIQSGLAPRLAAS